MKKYKKVWENYHGKKLPKDYEIHHIDGNHNNNDPINLLAVTIEEHLEIHSAQNNHGAVQAILIRMQRTPEQIRLIKEAASKHQLELLKNNKHNWQKFSERRKKAVQQLHRDRKAAGLGAFLGIKDTVENSRKAGKRSAELKAGFLDTNSEKHGSKFVKGTKWWTSNTGERVRSYDCPGKNWKRGMKYECKVS
jgi:hypothetical protein